MAKFYCPTKLSENISETPEGYLLCVSVPIARTGVMEYGQGETPLEVGDDGIVYMSRDATEVFDKVTIASFEGKSITIRHPEEFVGPDNWKELTKGTLHNVRRGKEKDEDGEEVLLADLLITEAFAISLVKNGLRELSCGYEAEYEQTGKGKGRQTKIVGNHLALVEEGRAGSSYAIHDHKRKVSMSKIAEKLKALLGKTIDEAVAAETKKPAKKAAAKDEGAPIAKKAAGSETDVVVKDSDAYDELKKMHDEMGKKLESLKPKSEDESKEKKEEEKSEDESEEEEKSEDESEEKKEEEKSEDEGEGEIIERVKALEAAVAKLLEMESEEEAEDEASEEESEDADLKGEEEEKPAKKKVGDKKTTGLEKTKTVSFESFDSTKEEMTAEKMNELNAAYWANKGRN